MPRKKPRAPEYFDAQLHDPGWEKILSTVPGKTLDDRILWGRAALTSGDTVKMQLASQYLGVSTDPLALAVRSAIAAQLEEWDNLLLLPVPKLSKNRRNIDAAVWMHLSRALALRGQHRYGDAIGELAVGMHLAREAKLYRREQSLRHHLRWIESQAGIAVPAVVEAELYEPMPAGGRLPWHLGNYATALLQRGYYHRASEAAPAGSDFHRLTLALQGISFEDGGLNDPASKATRSWLQAWNGQTVNRVDSLEGTLRNVYARLALYTDFSRKVQGAQLVAQLLGRTPPHQPDIAAIWAALGILTLGRGGQLAAPLEFVEIFHGAINRLDALDGVLNLLTRLMPEAVVALGMGPGAHQEVTLAAHILLSQSGKVPSDKILAAIQQQDVPAEPGRAPNPGVVLTIINQLVTTAQEEERSGPETAWMLARTQLLFEHGQNWGIASLESHCMGGGSAGKVEA